MQDCVQRWPVVERLQRCPTRRKEREARVMRNARRHIKTWQPDLNLITTRVRRTRNTTYEMVHAAQKCPGTLPAVANVLRPCCGGWTRARARPQSTALAADPTVAECAAPARGCAAPATRAAASPLAPTPLRGKTEGEMDRHNCPTHPCCKVKISISATLDGHCNAPCTAEFTRACA